MTSIPDVSFTVPVTTESASEVNRLINAFFSARKWARVWKIRAKQCYSRCPAQYDADLRSLLVYKDYTDFSVFGDQ